MYKKSLYVFFNLLKNVDILHYDSDKDVMSSLSSNVDSWESTQIFKICWLFSIYHFCQKKKKELVWRYESPGYEVFLIYLLLDRVTLLFLPCPHMPWFHHRNCTFPILSCVLILSNLIVNCWGLLWFTSGVLFTSIPSVLKHNILLTDYYFTQSLTHSKYAVSFQ